MKEIVSAPGPRDQILQPEWSFDGKMISYVKSVSLPQPESRLFVKNLATGEELNIGNFLSAKAKWMHHQDKLFYERAIPPFNTPTRPKRGLFCLDLINGTNDRFITDTFSGLSITFAPNDSFIVVNTEESLLILNERGQQLKKFEIALDNPEVSPDGKYIAFIDLESDWDGRIVNQFIKILKLADGSLDSFLISREISLSFVCWLNEATILYYGSHPDRR